MKKNLLFILFTGFLGTVNTNAQIPNNSFEDWTGTDPEGWQTNNAIGAFVTKVSPGHTGTNAARGDVQTVFSFNTPPLLASEGFGFPISQSYSTMYFFYKFNQVGTAQIIVSANFYNSDSSDAGYGVVVIPNPATGFTLGSAALNITGNPVRCIISATIIDPNAGLPQLGNYFILDDFTFDHPIGVPSVAGLDFYVDSPVPNPATTFTTIHFSIPGPMDVDLKIYDLLGRQLKMIQISGLPSGENFTNLDVQDLAEGTYILVLTSECGMLQQRLVITD